MVEYIKNIAQQNYFFDGDYSDVKIDPKLVIHGGDITHWWNCEATTARFSLLKKIFFLSGACRTPQDEFNDIWGQLYNAGIPMISAYGNHDWRPKIGTGNYWRGTPQQPRDLQVDQINQWSSDFTRESYERSLNLGASIGIEEYQELLPTGTYGQSMFRATFRGLQLASFNAAYNFQSYDITNSGTIYSSDEQLEQFAALLDRRKPTMFFSHFPLSSTRLENPTPTLEQVKALIREFPSGTHHFAGHYHVYSVQKYDEALPNFNDYIAPYPHTWNSREPGFLAVLASSKQGIIQVKPMTIPGLEDGTICIPADQSLMAKISKDPTQFLRERVAGDPQLGARAEKNGCEKCKAGAQYYSNTERAWLCGPDPSLTLVSDTQSIGELGDSLDEGKWEA